MELKGEILKLKERDVVQIFVPADKSLSIRLEVRLGKLFISGSASLINKIVGVGMSQKVCD